MSETSRIHKCLDTEDKKLILRIIDEAISREDMELRKISTKRMHERLVPPFVESFTGIHSSLVRVHKDYKQTIENLKKTIEEYPRCTAITDVVKQSVVDTGQAHIPGTPYELPKPFAERKLF